MRRWTMFWCLPKIQPIPACLMSADFNELTGHRERRYAASIGARTHASVAASAR
jgi:hypothetical protein